MAFPKEVGFGSDDMGRPKVLSQNASIAQIIYNIFLMEPGTYPSQPEKGIGIRRWLYKTEDEIDSTELKKRIFENCSDLISFLEFDDVEVIFTDIEGQGVLIVILPLKVTNESMLLAFSKGEENNVYFKFQVEALTIHQRL